MQLPRQKWKNRLLNNELKTIKNRSLRISLWNLNSRITRQNAEEKIIRFDLKTMTP